MPRLFTALEIPAPLVFSLSLLRGGLPGARWVDPENYHITLRFIGDIDQRTADEIGQALERVDRPRFRAFARRSRRLWGQQATFDRRLRAIVTTAQGTAGRARANHPADRARAGAAKIPPPRHARAHQGSERGGCRRLSGAPRRFPHAGLSGRAVRAALLARFEGWRTLCDGRGVSARGVSAPLG